MPISSLLFYILPWNSVCDIKKAYPITLPKHKFIGLAKPEISGGQKSPPLTHETCKNSVTHEALTHLELCEHVWIVSKKYLDILYTYLDSV